MNNKEYWQKREEEKLNKGIKDCNKLAKELQSQYKKAGKEIEKEINNLFEKYAKDNQLTYAEATKYLTGEEFKEWRTDIKGYLKMIEDNPELLLELNTLAMKSRITRLEALQYEVDKQLNKLAITTEKETEELLTDTLKDNYNRNIYNISKKTGFLANFSGINNKTIERILSYEWSGNNYSGRIWNNKQQLSKTIKEEIIQMLIRGESSKKVSQRVATRMNASYKNAVRLVQTEHSYVMEQANKITYEDLKVEKYQFLATPDERTCKVCGNLDLKIFNVKDMIPGKNCSPLHPSCRCTSLLYYEDEDDENSTRFARDKNGKRIEIPSNMTFNEWKKKYID
jgi:SPP1 gp7 family putative phage head morphogenesis protein